MIRAINAVVSAIPGPDPILSPPVHPKPTLYTYLPPRPSWVAESRPAGAVTTLYALNLAERIGVDVEFTPAVPPRPPEVVDISSVYDGDTFYFEWTHDGQEIRDRVRLACANSPEKNPAEPWATEATALTRAVLVGRKTRLLMGDGNPRDSYGRLLADARVRMGRSTLEAALREAYATRYSGDELERIVNRVTESMVGGSPSRLHNIVLSTLLVRAGLSHVFVIPSGPQPPHVDALIAAQAAAQADGIGMWSEPMYQTPWHMTSFNARKGGGGYLRLANMGTADQSLASFVFATASGRRRPFPDVVVPAGQTVMVHFTAGQNETDPEHQIRVYLDCAPGLWGDVADEAQIQDSDGTILTRRAYHPRVDPDGVFVWKNGEVVFSFGRHADEPLRQVAERDPGYLRYMLTGTYSEEVKEIVRRVMRGEVPVRAAA